VGLLLPDGTIDGFGSRTSLGNRVIPNRSNRPDEGVMSGDKDPPTANEPKAGDPPTPRKWWERPSVQFAGMVIFSAAAVISQAQTNPPAPPPRPAGVSGRLVPKPQPAATAEAKRHLDLGEDLYRRKEYAKAIEEFTIAIRAYPDYDEAYYHRGLAHGDFKRLDEAITDFTTAARLAPQKAEPFYRRGQVYAHLERFAEAVADYTEAIRLTPSNPEIRGRILYDRARAHFLGRSYPAASADCTAMLRLIPGAAEAYLLRGQATEADGDPAGATRDFREARRLDPEMYRLARAEWPTLPENP